MKRLLVCVLLLAVAGCGGSDVTTATQPAQPSEYDKLWPAWNNLDDAEQDAACERFLEEPDALVADMMAVDPTMDDAGVGAFFLAVCVG